MNERWEQHMPGDRPFCLEPFLWERHLLINYLDELERRLEKAEGATDMSVFLKVKARTLAEEAKIIRLERRKAKARARDLRLKARDAGANGDAERKAACTKGAGRAEYQGANLWYHDKFVVRREARATHLARNFLKGTPYRRVEEKNHPGRRGPDWDRVQRMVEKYGTGDPRDLRQRLAEWKDELAA